MSSLHNSKVGDFTRGGQVTIHFLRMTSQVIKRFIGAAIIVYSIGTYAIWHYQTDNYHRYVGMRYVAANIGMFYDNAETRVPLKMRDGSTINTTIYGIAKSPKIKSIFDDLVAQWWVSMGYSAATALTLLFLVMAYMFKFGADQRKEKHLRGGMVVDGPTLKRYLLRKRKASALKIAGIPIIKDSETTGILITGSQATGKTNAIFELLKVIRARGDRALTFSLAGDFIERFYKEGDKVLNPFDERCPAWDLWAECTATYHFDMIAAAIVPEAQGENKFWNQAARDVISSVLRQLADDPNRSIPLLVDYVSRMPMERLFYILQGTEAATVIDPSSEKTAQSIRGTAATYARSFKYLHDGGTIFRIREWVLNDEGSDWLFLNANAEQLESIRPVLTAWVEIFSSAVLSLPPSNKRRIWLILDELPALNKIPSLEQYLANARKHGGCHVLGFQQLSQLKDRYGQNGASTISGLCATRVAMRQNDIDSAKWVAGSFGEREFLEQQQGTSYGANEIRDGVSLTSQRKKIEIVLPSEILNLNNLEGYLMLPGDYPIGKFKTVYKQMKTLAPAYVPSSASVFTPKPKTESDLPVSDEEENFYDTRVVDEEDENIDVGYH